MKIKLLIIPLILVTSSCSNCGAWKTTKVQNVSGHRIGCLLTTGSSTATYSETTQQRECKKGTQERTRKQFVRCGR